VLAAGHLWAVTGGSRRRRGPRGFPPVTELACSRWRYSGARARPAS